jgi:hypothetical protein
MLEGCGPGDLDAKDIHAAGNLLSLPLSSQRLALQGVPEGLSGPFLDTFPVTRRYY